MRRRLRWHAPGHRHPDLEGARGFVGGRGKGGAGLKAKAREVARTDDLAILDIGGREGFAVVCAPIFHGIELAAATRDDYG